MGFSHEKTAHHFLLYDDGGAIEVGVLDAADSGSRDQIRAHLGHIAKMFAEGNFRAPMLIHSQTPPGVPVMQKLKEQIQYTFRTTERGAVVDIQTKNAGRRLRAVHAFLRFQISYDQTGDPETVAADRATSAAHRSLSARSPRRPQTPRRCTRSPPIVCPSTLIGTPP